MEENQYRSQEREAEQKVIESNKLYDTIIEDLRNNEKENKNLFESLNEKMNIFYEDNMQKLPYQFENLSIVSKFEIITNYLYEKSKSRNISSIPIEFRKTELENNQQVDIISSNFNQTSRKSLVNQPFSERKSNALEIESNKQLKLPVTNPFLLLHKKVNKLEKKIDRMKNHNSTKSRIHTQSVIQFDSKKHLKRLSNYL